MVFPTEVKGELEEEVEMMDIISKEGNVIGLTNSRNMDRANTDTKARVLCTLDLFEMKNSPLDFPPCSKPRSSLKGPRMRLSHST